MVFLFSISKESIIDISVKIVPVETKIESCTEQNLELSVLEAYVVSAAKPQLPLQIEDASRPEKDVRMKSQYVSCYEVFFERLGQ